MLHFLISFGDFIYLGKVITCVSDGMYVTQLLIVSVGLFDRFLLKHSIYGEVFIFETKLNTKKPDFTPPS